MCVCMRVGGCVVVGVGVRKNVLLGNGHKQCKGKGKGNLNSVFRV